jgi:hypothetical protein
MVFSTPFFGKISALLLIDKFFMTSTQLKISAKGLINDFHEKSSFTICHSPGRHIWIVFRDNASCLCF